MRQRGFSLMEVGMAVSVVAMMTGLALGAANVVKEYSEAEQLRSNAQNFVTAIENWRTASGTIKRFAAVESNNGAGMGEYVYNFSDTFVDSKQTSGTSMHLYTNPVTKVSERVWPVGSGAAAGSYPVGATTGKTYSSAEYPMDGQGGRLDLRGKILYIFKSTPTASNMKVWNGVADVYYTEYAVQAIGQKGYPVCTIGI